MRIEKENTVGLIIDIQERLFPAMNNKEVLLKNCITLIKGLQTLNIFLIVTQQYTKGLGETLESVRNEISDFNYIEKRDFSCCGESEFIELLKKSGAKNIIICGIEAHVCVLQTAIDLKEKGLNPVIVADCISSRKEKDLQFALERFRHEKIMMATYESILFELTQSSKAEEFKAVSNLVK
ncbi:MAG: isochorismatase family protein [Prolixibacteraceae bacterium]|nr:isochorismatase family protein [Prolixibacteraceae bacterium]MBN2775249.1 isochorismatase family protein [Prolixibacteraceae bacterium]